MNAPASSPPAQFQSFEERSDPGQVAPNVAALRDELARHELDAFLVPRSDIHQGEYVPQCDARLAYVTGFTGSAGMAVIGREAAGLFVDGRYTLQAPEQTDTDVVTVFESGKTTAERWLADTFSSGARIGFDPWLHTPSQIAAFEKKLAAEGIALVPVDNPIDAIWQDRPAPPQGPIEALTREQAGQSVTDKLAAIRGQLGDKGADALVLTLPESICWLFNIRGRDLPHNPFVLGFAIVPRDERPTLFLAPDKLTDATQSTIGAHAELARTDAFANYLSTLAQTNARVWIDPASAPVALRTLLSEGGAALIEERDPVMLPKARKNAAELAGMREAQALDALAMIRFLSWLDAHAPRGELTEIAIVNQLEAFRREADQLVDISFETISGSGHHGALPHYRVSESSNRTLMPGELMLVDSGGQYRCGTTDITRTMATGTPTDAQAEHFTRVLKGMIAVSRLRFPKGTPGNQIDPFARAALWQAGLNYAHGTGHGVGAFLSVHEGPASISPRGTVGIEAGMVLSNEPGLYIEGDYGIRIENLVVAVESPGNPDFLAFETLTYVPIDRRLIATALLTIDERIWLDAYHAETARRVKDQLDPETAEWLAHATAPL